MQRKQARADGDRTESSWMIPGLEREVWLLRRVLTSRRDASLPAASPLRNGYRGVRSEDPHPVNCIR